jgi:hypothetical protein
MHPTGLPPPELPQISPPSRRLLRLVTVASTGLLLILTGACGSGTHGNQFVSNTPPPTGFPPAMVPLVKLSTDAFSNSSSQHATEVEPDSFSFGTTIISSFQVARIFGGGAADIGYAISNDSGLTWQNGLLPGLTTFEGGGTNSAATDTSVIHDAAHGVWIISSLTISAGSTQVVVSRSADGGATWSNPIIVSQSANLDKSWIACDNSATSPHYGNCYMEWDDNGNNNLILMSTSTDGGLTWSPALSPAGSPSGLGGQPMVEPNGNVIVPFLSNANAIQSFMSTNGGTSWSSLVQVAAVTAHTVAGGLRSLSLPSAQRDAAGIIYVVWEDCRFRVGCPSNDLVMSTSGDGTTWSSPARIPTDATTSTVDHFIPGLGIDPATSAGTAHLGLAYYYYPQANCTNASCVLFAGFISSSDGGTSWSAPRAVAGPMSLGWLPSTDSGLMVADYISTSFVGGKAYVFFAVAKAKSGSSFDEAIYTTESGFELAAAPAVNTSAGEQPISRAMTSESPARSLAISEPVRR